MSRNYKFHNPEGLYFISFATVFWVDVFVRRIYFDCIVENLNYCVANKGMEIYAWCVMPSHIHLVFRSNIQKPDELLRDFKSFTSKQLIKLIEENMLESRREWLLNSFKNRHCGATSGTLAVAMYFSREYRGSINPTVRWSNDRIIVFTCLMLIVDNTSKGLV